MNVKGDGESYEKIGQCNSIKSTGSVIKIPDNLLFKAQIW